MMEKFKIIDLFCGTGGFAHGFLMHYPGFELVYAVDNNIQAAETAKANHPSCIVDTNDIRTIKPEKTAHELGYKRVDVVIGGPPCQGFSSLRPNRSTNNNDKRNNLFLNFCSFLRQFQPRVFVLENVVGLLTHNKGETLDIILKTFSRLRYNTDWRILNAASYGVPQKRERFILIGSKEGGQVIFPKPTRSFNGKVIGHRDKSRTLVADKNSPKALTVNDAISDLPPLEHGQEATSYTRKPKNDYQRFMRGTTSKLTLHKATNHSDKMIEVIQHSGDNIYCIPKHLISSGFSSCYSRLNGNEPSTTITVKFQSPASSKCIHPTQDRTITPREAARLQSFPDGYIFKGSLTNIASQLGNAVPPLLGKAVASSVLQMLKEGNNANESC